MNVMVENDEQRLTCSVAKLCGSHCGASFFSFGFARLQKVYATRFVTF